VCKCEGLSLAKHNPSSSWLQESSGDSNSVCICVDDWKITNETQSYHYLMKSHQQNRNLDHGMLDVSSPTLTDTLVCSCKILPFYLSCRCVMMFSHTFSSTDIDKQNLVIRCLLIVISFTKTDGSNLLLINSRRTQEQSRCFSEE
jgi:hypothetical protein